MTGRLLAWIATAICAVILLCGGLTGLLLTGGSAASTCGLPFAASAGATGSHTASAAPSAGFRPIGRWDSEQVANAAAILAVGVQRQIPDRAWVIAIATALQESRLRNLPGGDRDSVGLFQQRPSQGWGSTDQLMDPAYAAGKFFDKLLTVDGWQAMTLTEAAQAVQVSAHPDAYAKWEPDAVAVVAALTGVDGLAACNVTVSAEGWTQPVRGTVGSGFRTPDRPTHDGVDIIVDKETPIHAAAAGTVSRVRCNAVDVRTGGDWGCDRDGDPILTRGCGWYVDITHAGNVVTRYCHMLARPAVSEGQPVNAGDVIGVSGSSGHSSGPHVHYEVHLGDHSSGTAVDPVPFMASVGAPLGRMTG